MKRAEIYESAMPSALYLVISTILIIESPRFGKKGKGRRWSLGLVSYIDPSKAVINEVIQRPMKLEGAATRLFTF